MSEAAMLASSLVAPATFAGQQPKWPMVYVCLLNWNGWRDTIECLASLLALDYPAFRVLICDNGSSDGSCEKLAAWIDANGASFGAPAKVASEVFLDIPRAAVADASIADERVVLIRNGANLGFAAGNNSGIEFALRQPECQFVWLLNNDTAADAGALKALVSVFNGNPAIGTCGSRLVYFHSRDRVQALGGGVYDRWFSLARHVGENMPTEQSAAVRQVKIDYPCAASMLISRAFLEDVGLMSEDYFLYFEELDWMRRAGGRYQIGYAPESVVFHKEGQSIGTDGRATGRSLLSDYYLTRSRFVFTRKFHPYAVPTLLCWLLAMVVARMVRHGPSGVSRSRLVLLAAWDGLTGRFRTLSLSRQKPAEKSALEKL